MEVTFLDKTQLCPCPNISQVRGHSLILLCAFAQNLLLLNSGRANRDLSPRDAEYKLHLYQTETSRTVFSVPAPKIVIGLYECGRAR